MPEVCRSKLFRARARQILIQIFGGILWIFFPSLKQSTVLLRGRREPPLQGKANVVGIIHPCERLIKPIEPAHPVNSVGPVDEDNLIV